MAVIIGIDLETTGLNQEDGHRIIEIALLSYDSDTQELTDKWIQRFDPERPIDAAAQAVHGIAYSDLATCPKWQDMAEEVSKRIAEASLLVAHNMAFDGPFVGAELLRVGAKVPDVSSFCTMENARWACADGKLPKLGELCFALNIPYDAAKAHAAEYDVQCMMACFFKASERGFFDIKKRNE